LSLNTVLHVLLDTSHGPLVRGLGFRNTFILILIVVGARTASRSDSRRRRRPTVIRRNGSGSG
jgi:hypothetical protein